MSGAAPPKGAHGPAVYTIPAGVPFVDALAAGLHARVGGGPEALAQATVLLPTRRACRALREAFLRQSGGRPLLLPRLTPLGDVDEDELALAGLGEPPPGGGTEGGFGVPPEISGLRRHLLLTRLVLAFEGRRTTADQAARLAAELARLLDQVHTEGLSFDALAELVPEEFADHWRITLKFLRIITERWPAVLAEEGCVDPMVRRNLLLEAQADAWRKAPPAGPVVAAGSTGSIPATADLLKVVAGLPGGCVVLPGLDRDADDETWQALEPSHPQFGMARLLEHLGIAHGDVEEWPSPGVPAAPAARAALVNAALRPAATGARRPGDAPPEEALAGVTRIDCPGPQEEAGVIALVMRETLEHADEGRTAALVTPDRALARRVASELGRWGIEVDDSAGRPLAQTAPGAFLRLTARMAAEAFAPVPLLAALKHPLAAGGQAPAAFRGQVRRLEIAVLRGPRPGPGVKGLRAALPRREKALRRLLTALDTATRPFARMLRRKKAPLRQLLRAHVDMAEALAATDAETGADRLWAGEAGEAAAGFVHELDEAAGALKPLPGAGYAALLETLMARPVVRPRFGLHPRLHIWGLLEARLQHADVLILGGLNEDTWPPEAHANPWMSRPMLAQFGLPLPERRVGLAAHDFAQAFSAPSVVLTRAERVEGTPTVPSRWLLRLENLLRGTGPETEMRGDTPWLRWQGLLDAPRDIRPSPPPAPKPPLGARPRRLSVTQVETWMRDPYAIYARHVLRLAALEPIDADPGAADYGSIIHHALDAFLKENPGPLPGDAAGRLLEIGRRAFAPYRDRPGVWAFWWPRFERIAGWFVDVERDRRADLKASASEADGRLTVDGPAGPFVLTAKADRIDTLADGTLAVIDYKTGAPPSKREVAAGFAPQLPLEATIAQAGGFAGVPGATVSALDYWRLRGGEPAGERVSAAGTGKDGKDVPTLIAEALDGLGALIAAFDREDTPYEARPRPDAAPRFSDYEHLARIKEWSTSGEEDAG